jgi:hypothetical protein
MGFSVEEEELNLNLSIGIQVFFSILNIFCNFREVRVDLL